MKQTKKILSVFLALLMIFSSVPLSGSLADLSLFTFEASAADNIARGECGENLTWVLDDAGKLTISGEGRMIDFNSGGAPWFSYRTAIETVVIEDGVTSIGYYAFQDCASLLGITIPNSVTDIGSTAFGSCMALTSVTIPDGVTNIGTQAFHNCTSLTSIAISGSVEKINYGVFYNCTSLTSVNISEGVTSIDANAFAYCTSLINVTIPYSVASIAQYAFNECNSLATVYYGGGIIQWSTLEIGIGNDCLKNAEIVCSIPSGKCRDNLIWILDDAGTLTISGEGAMTDYNAIDKASWYSYRSNIKTVVIENSVTNIGDYAFGGCYLLESVVIPDSVTSIGTHAFEYCGFTSVNIPDSVTSIGTQAFSNCSSLTSVNIPDSVTSIGTQAFSNCSSLTSVIFRTA